MKFSVVYTSRAQDDLKSIYEYIAHSLFAQNSAVQITKKIMETARTLEILPERNPLYKDEPWRSQGVRFAVVRNYLLFYTVDVQNGTVTVFRIMYGGRDINRQLEESVE